MNKRTWIIFIVICVAVFGMLIATSRGQSTNVDNVDTAKIQPATPASGDIADHVYGNPNGKVILIEYGDFQCPGCGAAFPVLQEMSHEYKDKMAFVFRNFPLTTIHPNAKAAAAAAEAAGLQGKYWEMHDKLYETQNAWSTLDINSRTGAFTDSAKAVGVKDLDKFKKDMSADSVTKKITFDLALGKKIGVDGTPSIYLNNKKVESDTWNDKEKMKQAIEEALK
jgi:protein-disulfide isomerase